MDGFRGDGLDSGSVAFLSRLFPSEEEQSGVTSGEARTYPALHPRMGKNTDGENRKSDSLLAFIQLMRSSWKNELAERCCQQGGIQNLRSCKEKLSSLGASKTRAHSIAINVLTVKLLKLCAVKELVCDLPLCV